MSGMGARAERPRPGRRASAAAAEPKPRMSSQRLRAMLPELWALVRPRRWLLLAGLVLMGINRVAGLVLPASTKYLIDDVLGKGHREMLPPLVGAVVGATLIQGLTSFALTQLLSKAAQRLIADMRRQVQAHVGRLPVAYYDVNKTGALVSRIMSDVEGVRNLVGTGLVEFAGGLLTAVLALILMLRISATMTLVLPWGRSASCCSARSASCAPSSASGARSTPRSRAASRSRSAACGW
jgi:subfamily B ATP-binding cassette protein MsbA